MKNALKGRWDRRTNARRAPLLLAGTVLLVALAPMVEAQLPLLPDLAVTKEDTPDPIEVGGVVTYYINVTNIGLGTATLVRITDTLPPGTTLLSVSPTTGCSRSPGQFQCDVGPIAPGGWYNLTVGVRMDEVGEKTNTVTVATRGEVLTDNNQASATTTVLPLAPDLHVEKTDVADPVYLGQNIEWIVTVTNEGTAPAENVTIVDVAPTGVSFVSVTPSAGCTRGPPGTLTCNIGTLAPGASYELRIVGEPTLLGPNLNVVTVASDQRERDLLDNVAEEITTVRRAREVDLALTKDDLVDPVFVGDNITYVINVTNVGRTTAHNVTITDNLPDGVTLLAVSPAAGCERFAGGFRCNIGTMAPGDFRRMRVDVRADEAGVMTNGATVDPGDGAVDRDRSNNAQREQTTVNTRPPAQIECIAQPDEDVLVSWTPAPGALGYDIYRAVDGGAFEFLDSTTQTSYEDTTTEAGHTYEYYVVSTSDAGASAPSDTCTVTAIPFFPSALAAAIAVVGSVLAVVGFRRWQK